MLGAAALPASHPPSPAPSGPSGSPGFGLLGLLRRERGAARLSARILRRGFLSRAGRFYSWGAALSFGALLFWAAGEGAADEAPAILRTALVPMSWAAGLVAMASARDLPAEEERAGLGGLAGLAGLTPASVRRARLIATLSVVTRALALPALLLGLFGIFVCLRAGAHVPLIPWVVGALAYSLVFGAVFGGLARWSSGSSREHGQLVFFVLVVLPYAGGLFGEEVPNLVAGFGWLIEHVGRVGGLS